LENLKETQRVIEKGEHKKAVSKAQKKKKKK
jgi:hypothetical protein